MSEEKKKGVYKNFLTGGIASSVARTCTNPLERVEMIRQVQNSEYKGLSMTVSIMRIYNTQGILGLFKGLSASISRAFPFAALEFYFYEKLKNIFIRSNNNGERVQNIMFRQFLCGGLTGLIASTLTFPLDVARTRLGVTTLHSKIKENRLSLSLYNLWKNDGIRGLYKGYTIASFGSLLFTAIKQSSFDHFKFRFAGININNNMKNLIFGSLSGFLGTTMVYPPYLIKRVMQANGE